MKFATLHRIVGLSIALVLSLGGLVAQAQIQPQPIALGRTTTSNYEVFFLAELADDATEVTFTLTPEPLTTDRKHYPIVFVSWGDLVNGPNQKKQQMINLAYDMTFTLPVDRFQGSASKFLFITGDKGIWSLTANGQKIKAVALNNATSLRAVELNDNLLGKEGERVDIARAQYHSPANPTHRLNPSSFSGNLFDLRNLENLSLISLNRNYLAGIELSRISETLRVLELSGNRLTNFSQQNRELAALDLSLNLLDSKRTSQPVFLTDRWASGTSNPNGHYELIYSRRGTEATMATMRDDVTYQSRYLDLSHNRLTLAAIPRKPANLPAEHYLVSYQERFRLPTLTDLADDGETGILDVGKSLTLPSHVSRFQGLASSAQNTTIKWYVENDAATDNYTEVDPSFYTMTGTSVTFHKHPTGNINSKFFAVAIPANGTMPTQVSPTAKKRSTTMWPTATLQDYRFQSYERTNTPRVEAYDPITQPLERLLDQPAGTLTTMTLRSGAEVSATGIGTTGDGTARTSAARFYRSNVFTLDPYTNNYWHGTVSNEWQDPRNWTGGVVPITTKNEYMALTAAQRAKRSRVEFASRANNKNNPAIRDLELDQDRYVYGYWGANERGKVISVPPGNTLFHEQGYVQGITPYMVRLRAAKDKPNGAYIYLGRGASTSGIVPGVELEFYAKGENATLTEAQTKWQYFTIPLRDTYDANWASADAQNSAYVKTARYDRTLTGQFDNKWTNISTNALRPVLNEAYRISQPKPTTHRFVGSIFYDDATFQAVGTSSPNVYDNMNLFGNPYVAAMSIKSLVFPASGVEKVVYLFNTGSREQWLAGAGGTTPNTIPGSYTAGIPQGLAGHLASMPTTIPSLSTFMVKATGGGTITFPYTALVGNTEVNRARLAPEAEPNITSLTIDLATDSVAYDRLWLVTAEGTTSEYDDGYDAEKFIAGNIAQLYAMGEKNYQVLTTDNVHGTRLAVSPGTQARDLSLRFTIERPEFNANTYYVDDHATGKTIVVSDGDVYKFTAKPTDPLHRFTVRTNNVTNIGAAQAAIEIVAISDRTIEVRNHTDKEVTAKLYDVKGVLLETLTIAAGSKAKAEVDMPGFYIVNATNGTTTADARFLLK